MQKDFFAMKQHCQIAHLAGALILLELSLCVASAGRAASPRAVYPVEQVKKELAPLSFESTSSYPPATRQYFKYYGLNVDGAQHCFGTFESGDYELAAHVFKPRQSKGSVILLHGYYDHSGILKNLIRSLVKQGYTVALYDQPGHGLSSGAGASIEDFSEYVSILEAFLRICRGNLRGPFHLVAHSMGCTVATDYLLTTKSDPLDRVVFLSPLVHSAAWKVSGWGHSLAGSTVDHVPRVFRKQNSSDKEFIKFMKDDPLQTRHVPMKWVNALREWNCKAAEYGTSEKRIKIIQGTRDTVVDRKYSTEFIKRKFRNTDTTLIQEGGHQLINESPPMRANVLNLINDYLRG